MKHHKIVQGSPEWFELRLGKVTASCASLFMSNDGKAFGEPAQRYALQIALEQLTGNKAEYSFQNEHMTRGQEQEPIARSLYEQETFCDVEPGGFFDWVTYGTSPDGLIGEEGIIEIKCVVASTHYATLKRGSYDPAYKWQIISHLDCTGSDWVDFVSYCSDFPEDKQLIVSRLYRKDCYDELKRLRSRRYEFLQLIENILGDLS